VIRTSPLPKLIEGRFCNHSSPAATHPLTADGMANYHDAYMSALQSESVTLKVGPKGDHFVVSKGMLTRQSDTFNKLLSKPGLTELELPGVGLAVGKMFVCWCYQVRIVPSLAWIWY
jgi:hypothetical protein